MIQVDTSLPSGEFPILPFSGFSDWLRGVLTEVEPDQVVCIARGALRCVELFGGIEKDDQLTILSHHALPYLTDEEITGKRVLVLDDSVNFGSTMNSVRDYVEGRGAFASCAAYAVDSQGFLGEDTTTDDVRSPYSSLPLRYSRKLSHDGMRRHHASLVRSLLASVMGYNPDFPKLLVSLGRRLTDDGVSSLLATLSSAPMVRRCVNVSAPQSELHRVRRYTVLLDHDATTVPVCEGVSFFPHSKLRITVDASKGTFSVTPIMQLHMREGIAYDEFVFADGRLMELWRTLSIAVGEGDRLYYAGLFRLLTTFYSILLARQIQVQLTEALDGAGESASARIDFADTAAILGNRNAEAARNVWSALEHEDIQLDHISTNLLAPTIEDESLQARIVHQFTRSPRLRPDTQDESWEAVGKVFIALRAVTDGAQERRENPDVGRLDKGLSFADVQSILAMCCDMRMSDDEVSVAMDFLIDRGLAVPKVLQVEGGWCRLYYSGEAEEDQDTLQLKRALHDAYRDYRKSRNVKPLDVFEFQKLCVLLSQVCEWLPLTVKPSQYGYVSVGKVGDERSMGWLTDGDFAPCVKRTIGGKHVLEPNSRFRSPVELTWSHDQCLSFFDGFDYAAKAIQRLPSEAALLMTSCRTHRHTFNAVAYEAARWAGQGPQSMRAAVHGFREGALGDGESRSRALNALYWCVQYLSEARKKERIFTRRFPALTHKIDAAFHRQGRAAHRWYQFRIAKVGLLDPERDPEVERKWRFLTPLLEQMERLTRYVVDLVQSAGWMSQAELATVFANHGVSLQHREYGWIGKGSWLKAGNSYNKRIQDRSVPSETLVTETIPVDEKAFNAHTDEFLRNALGICGVCASELGEALHHFCPRYDDEHGEFPYAPLTTHRKLGDGTSEIRRDSVFLLVMDIIGSTDSPQTNEMKDVIANKMREFAKLGVTSAPPAGDDAFVAIADDPAVLKDLAHVIAVSGDDLYVSGERFMGTRKALYYGTVAVVEGPSGVSAIRDVQVPNIIPLAFAVLNGIDRNLQERERNAHLAIDAWVLGKCGPRFDRYRKEKKVGYDSKHGMGHCYLIPLLD